MATLPVGKGYTPAQWEAWFNANSSPANPRYTGTAKAGVTPLAGKTWAQVFAAIYANEHVTPDQAGSATDALAAEEAIAVGAGAAASGAGAATAATAAGVSSASYLPSWLNGLAGLGKFLDNLANANLWIRVAKVVAGGAAMIIGLAHISGASNAVAQAARKVPVPV